MILTIILVVHAIFLIWLIKYLYNSMYIPSVEGYLEVQHLPYVHSMYSASKYRPMMSEPPGYDNVYDPKKYTSSSYLSQSGAERDHPEYCKKNPECYPCPDWKFAGPPQCV